MSWEKLGLIFSPVGKADWYVSHAMVPLAEELGGENIRVYFGGRDSEGRSQIGYFEFRIAPPYPVTKISACPGQCN